MTVATVVMHAPKVVALAVLMVNVVTSVLRATVQKAAGTTVASVLVAMTVATVVMPVLKVVALAVPMVNAVTSVLRATVQKAAVMTVASAPVVMIEVIAQRVLKVVPSIVVIARTSAVVRAMTAAAAVVANRAIFPAPLFPSPSAVLRRAFVPTVPHPMARTVRFPSSAPKSR